ncbi:MAG: hypothetical protein ACRDTH_17370 [Pseudonocardiaceae bacterium]
MAGADLYDWIALRRVSGGGIARVGDRWFDSGRRVPGYVADALATLCEAGLVRLVDLERMAMARAALTDAGAIRYERQCRQRQKALRVPAAPSGATGSAAADQIGILVAVCRLLLLCWGHQPASRRCPTCEAPAVVPISAPQCHNSPDTGRPPVEHAPGGRPDTTTLQPPGLTADEDRETAHHGDTRTRS